MTFDLGTNLDIAQVQVQNRMAIALPRLPADVRNIGVTVTKASPDLMMVVHLFSPDKSRDTLFISNYATLEIKDVLARVDGVGSITVFGSRDYAMRIWLDPDRLQSLGMTANDVTAALQGQNIQVASGVLDQPPVPKQGAFQIAVQDARTARQSRRIRQHRREADAGWRWCGSRMWRASSWPRRTIHRTPISIAIRRWRSRSSSGRARTRSSTAKGIIDTMATVSKRFPPGIKYDIIYNPTEFIQESVNEVQKTILIAVLLVVLVVILFLQTWRAAIIPIVAIPVSLIGTFFFMAIFGFTLNNLSLFGLVLAIGIVVDDAIVVVENVERNIAAGLSPRDAAFKSMDEVGSALIAIALVLCAVFVPSAFITGISGQFYRQFALTIAGATIISLIVSLTLSPAMCALFLKPHDPQHRDSLVGAADPRLLPAVQPRLRRVRARLRLAHRARGPVRGADARRLCRRSRLRPQRISQDAHGLHSAGRSRLSHRRGAAAAGRLALPHRRGAAARGRHCAQDAGRCACGERRRLLRRDLHQRAECRRDLPGARTVGGARQGCAEIRGAIIGLAVRQACPRSRRGSCSWSRRRRSPGSAMPAVSA